MDVPTPRLILLPAVVLLVAGAECSGGAPTTHWYLVAGQSNAHTRSTQPTLPAEGLVFRVDHELLLSIADPHVSAGSPPDRFSVWPPFANHQRHDHGLGVNLITTAEGATCLLSWPADDEKPPLPGHWDPSPALDDPPRAGAFFDRAIETWAAAGSPPVRAVLWHQGECDQNWARVWSPSEAGEARLAYREALEELADAFMAALGAPMVVAPISLRACEWENETCDLTQFPDPEALPWEVGPIRDATLDAANAHPHIHLGPLHDDVRMCGPDCHPVHVYDVNELGRRWSDAVAAAFGDGPAFGARQREPAPRRPAVGDVRQIRPYF